MTADVQDRLNQFWKNGKIQGVATNRTYDSIFRIAEAQARLNLSNKVTDDIATQAMDSISLMLSQYGKIVQTIRSPRDITYEAFVIILRRIKTGISIRELCKIVGEENKQIAEYLDDNWNVEHNHKLRTVIDLLLNHGKIKQVNAKPMVLQYIDSELSSDTSDLSDTTVKANQNKAASFTSDISDISDSTSSNMKMMVDVTTDERNHRASDTSDLSDIYDATTGMHLNSEQESRSIFRFGHSDIWACENCKQKDDVHYMRQHLCRGEIK
jgi:hypothetical protein